MSDTGSQAEQELRIVKQMWKIKRDRKRERERERDRERERERHKERQSVTANDR